MQGYVGSKSYWTRTRAEVAHPPELAFSFLEEGLVLQFH